MQPLSSRRSFLGSLACSVCVVPVLSASMHTGARTGTRRIGLLVSSGYEPMITAFKEGLGPLRQAGRADVEILVREWESNSQDLASVTAELLRARPHFIVAGALPQAMAIRKADPSMPMVIVTCPGMVTNGFARSMVRPGGNVTGMDELPPGVTGKRLALLKAAAPSVSRVALLSTTPGRGGHEIQLAEALMAAGPLQIAVRPYRASTPPELVRALEAIVADGMNGMANFQGRLSLANREMIVSFAAKHRLPAVYQATLFAEAGGLMSWAPDLVDQYRTAGRYADRIVRGDNPGDLPIQHPNPYYLTIHAGAARGLGLKLPAQLLAQADRIID